MIRFIQPNRQRSATVWGKAGIWAAAGVDIAVGRRSHTSNRLRMPLRQSFEHVKDVWQDTPRSGRVSFME
jgi:hypothetical protein